MQEYKLPRNTCPLIDEVLQESKNLARVVEREFEYFAKRVDDLMEDIRESNSKLREAAEGYKEQVEELEQENKELKQKVKEQENI